MCHPSVHDDILDQVEMTKYLGDIIHKDCKLSAIMADWLAKAVACLSIIQAFLKDIPLWEHNIEIELDLRKI